MVSNGNPLDRLKGARAHLDAAQNNAQQSQFEASRGRRTLRDVQAKARREDPATKKAEAQLGKLELDSAEFAHWDVEASAPNWRVATRYDFLRQEQMIRANMAEPLIRQIPRSLGWTLDYLISGALYLLIIAGNETMHREMLGILKAAGKS